LRIHSTAKPEIELAFVHGLVAVLHLARIARRLFEMVSMTASTSSPDFLANECLPTDPRQSGDADLVDHLGELARACGPEPFAHPGIGRDHRLALA